MNLIRNLSDMNAKITFISRTMINVKGITEFPKIKTEVFQGHRNIKKVRSV